jgi:hypothetical protein
MEPPDHLWGKVSLAVRRISLEGGRRPCNRNEQYPSNPDRRTVTSASDRLSWGEAAELPDRKPLRAHDLNNSTPLEPIQRVTIQNLWKG